MEFLTLKKAKDFCNLIRSCIQKPFVPNPIAPSVWKRFYDQVYPPRTTTELILSDVGDPLLDSEIALTIKKLKNDKSPGKDLISAEFFKHLPDQWHSILHSLFNNINGSIL